MKKFIFSFALLLSFALPSYSDWDFTQIWIKEAKNDIHGLFGSVTLNPNDSLLITSNWDGVTNSLTKIYKLNALTGVKISEYQNLDSIINLNYSNDGGYLSGSGRGYLGLVDTVAFRYTSKIPFKDVKNHSYNESKKIITGFSSNTIKLFNTETKELIKEYDNNYFKIKDIELLDVALSNVEDKVIYTYTYYVYTGPKPGDGDVFTGLKIIDKDGKELYGFEMKGNYYETKLFALSHEGNKLAFYCEETTKIKVMDIKTMEIIAEGEGANSGNGSALDIQFSYDDKYIYSGYFYALKRLEILIKKTEIINSKGTFRNFQFPRTNLHKVYFLDVSQIILYNMDPKSSIQQMLHKDSIFLNSNPQSNNLELNCNFQNSYLLNISLYNINGIKIKELENKVYNYGNFKINFDISNIPTGAYYLQIKLNGNIFPQTFNFIKNN